MIIGITEYGEVRIYDDLEHVTREWGAYPTDIGNVIEFYDGTGNWLEPVLSKGPRRWFGLRPGVTSVTLRAAASGAPWVDPLAMALHQAISLVPNRHISELSELRRMFPYAS